MDDQVLCVVYWKTFKVLRERLRPYSSSEELAHVEQVIERLGSFTQQAEQLYGIYEFTGFVMGKLLEGEVFIDGDTGINRYTAVQNPAMMDSERVREG